MKISQKPSSSFGQVSQTQVPAGKAEVVTAPATEKKEKASDVFQTTSAPVGSRPGSQTTNQVAAPAAPPLNPKHVEGAKRVSELLEAQESPETEGSTKMAATLAREVASGRASEGTIHFLKNSADPFLRSVGQAAMLLTSTLRGETKNMRSLFGSFFGIKGKKRDMELLLGRGSRKKRKKAMRRFMDKMGKKREVRQSASFRKLYKAAKEAKKAAGTSSLSRSFQVQAAGHWRPTPVISQLNPRGGTEDNYKNGVYNCAGAAVAMLARGLGFGDELSDAELINKLSSGLTTKEGTTLDGVGTMLNRIGAQLAGKVMVGGYSDDMVRNHLASGNKLVAQLGIHNVDTGKVSPHYVVVDRMDAAGNYIVKDPLMGRELAVTPRQLRDAMDLAPGAGGALIPIAGAATPPPESAKVNAEVGDGFGAAPVLPLAAFETANQVVAGRDTSYHALAPTEGGVDTSLSSHFSTGLAQGSATQVASTQQSTQEITTAVQDLFKQADETLREAGRLLYQQLAASADPKDQQAAAELAKTLGKQPGIGQKVEIDVF
jgi:hypothetical protein